MARNSFSICVFCGAGCWAENHALPRCGGYGHCRSLCHHAERRLPVRMARVPLLQRNPRRWLPSGGRRLGVPCCRSERGFWFPDHHEPGPRHGFSPPLPPWATRCARTAVLSVGRQVMQASPRGNHHFQNRTAGLGQGVEEPCPDTFLRPANKAIVEGFPRPLDLWRIDPAAARL